MPKPSAVRGPTPCAEPDVLVVVVTYNSAAVVERFLASLPEALDGVSSVHVVVVDNASSDGTERLVSTCAPWVEVIRNATNVGYAAGINTALRRRRGRHGVLVLNPDAVPAHGCVRVLLDALERPGTGISVPRILDEKGQLKFSLRREPTILRALGEAVLGGHRAARWQHFGDMVRNPEEYRDGAVADWATGAAMMLSRELVDRTGLWDEKFFLYSEETDYALRARDAGYALRYARDAVVVHPGGEMSRSPWLWTILVRSRVTLYRKRNSAPAAAVYWLVVLVNEGLRSLQRRPTHRAAFRSMLLRRSPPQASPSGPSSY